MFFIKSSKLLVLVTTLCVMVTNSSKASNAIEVLDSNNIEHSSNIVERNMESVVIGDNNINESHNNNEVNNNHNNLEHNNNNINQENINNEHNNSYSVNENADQNNNNDVILAVKGEGIQVGNNKEESLYNIVKKICSGIIVVPVSFCSYVISVLNFDIDDTARTMLHDASIAVMKPAFDSTIKSVWNSIIIMGNKTTNIFGNAKSWLLNRISN